MAPTDAVDELQGFGIEFGKKKRRNIKKLNLFCLGEVDSQRSTLHSTIELNSSGEIVDLERDYAYNEWLARVMSILKEKNPDMVAGKKQKFVMRPPQVIRIGTKKTAFSNFPEVNIIFHISIVSTNLHI